MRTETNEMTGILEGFVPAKLIAMPKQFTLKNSKNTMYGIATVEVTYEDGSTDTANAVMYENSSNTGLFKEGIPVELRVQLEGEYAGNSVVQLPGLKKVDLAKLGIKVNTTATTKEPAVTA